MIRTVVTWLNRWYRLSTITPSDLVENKYPRIVAERIQQQVNFERQKIVKEQKLRIELAQATPIERQFINLREEYFGKKVSNQEYEARKSDIQQKQHQQELARKGLL